MGLNESSEKSDRGHEPRDINVQVVMLFFVSLATVVILAVALSAQHLTPAAGP